MTVLNHEIHSNIADAKAMMQLFKSFAVAQGWTLLHNEQSKSWVITTGWIAGTEDFIAIKSTGYGSQDLQFRFSITNLAANTALIRTVGYRGATALDFAVATHPVNQTTAGQQRWSDVANQNTTLPDAAGGPIETVWFFGNDKFLYIICKTAIDYCVGIAIGTPELYDSSEDEANYAGWIQGSLSGANYYYNKTLRMPLDTSNTEVLYYDGVLKPTTGTVNFTFSTAGIATVNALTGAYGRLVRQNSYSEVKPIFKQTMYVQHASDSAYRAVGTMWCYRIYFEATWEIGRHVLYGAEEYILFPGGKTGWPAGYAFRIS